MNYSAKQLSDMDYQHWMKQVGQSCKVYKDEVCHFKDGKEVCVKKFELSPSPVVIEVR